MASTEQSAVDYIQNGRRLLVDSLENHSLVIDQLHKHNVLHQGEVSYLSSMYEKSDRSRKMLDMTVCKGEAACYKLLKILYTTRTVSLKQDMHYWISCFSFRDDSTLQSDFTPTDSKLCFKYMRQLKLKAIRIYEARQKKRMYWLKNSSTLKPFTYIPLVLDPDRSVFQKSKISKNKAYKKSRSKKLQTYIPAFKRKLSPDNLLTGNEKKILLVGKPGIGKTTVAQEILNLWAQKEDNAVSYMFYFNESLMRSMSHSDDPTTLKSLLFGKYVKPEEGIEEILQDIEQNSENVIIVFDGIMDAISNSVVKRILEKDLLCDAKIVTTCRPEAEDCGFLSDWPSYRVEVHGFNDASIRSFFRWMFDTDEDAICRILNNPELFSLCHVPMYAFIVTACICLSVSKDHPCTVTEMYVQILRDILKIRNDQTTEHLGEYMRRQKEALRSLAESAYQAMLGKTVNVTRLDGEDHSVVDAFLTSSAAKDTSTSSWAFLHNTMQEFWASVFLLMTPDKITQVLQQCQTEEGKYLKHIFSFLCGLSSQSNNMVESIKFLISEEEVRELSDQYIEKIIDSFIYCETQPDPDESNSDVDMENLLFICQCLYEHQSPDACLLLLEKVGYEFNLSGEQLDPQQCCAVSYVISQSKDRNVQLDLEDCSLSDPGLRLILRALENLTMLRLDSITQLQMWKVALRSGLQKDCDNLLRLCESEIHLSVQEQEVWKPAEEVLKQKRPEHIHLCLHVGQGTQHITTSSMKIIFDRLSNIADIRFISLNDQKTHSWNEEVKSLQMDLYIQGALYEVTTGQKCVEGLRPVLAHLIHSDSIEEQSKFVVSLYSKAHDTQEGLLPVLQPVFQTTPAVWYIDLSEKGTSGILEVLKFLNVKKPVELWWSDEESERELTIFLQCLPYISELRFNDCIPNTNDAIKVLVDLFICAATLQGETLNMLSSVCGYSAFPFADQDNAGQCDFLLDLYSHVSDYETQTGRSVLPALLPLYRTAPAVWSVDLSERKASLLLEVLKLQPEKRPVELRDWSGDESDVMSFLQCLPYISHLGFLSRQDEGELPEVWRITFFPWSCRFLLKVFLQGAVNDILSGQRSVEALLSALGLAHSYDSTEKCMLLLDLYSHAKDYEIQTGRSVLPALQPVYWSTPAAWSIDLSERKASLLLEVLKLQPGMRPVELRGCSDDESDVRSFLPCLPYISYLICDCQFFLSVCDALSVGFEGDALLSHCLLQALHYTLTLSGWLPSVRCEAVGAVLGQSTADEELDVTLIPQSISLQGAKLLFKQVKELHKLRMNEMATVKLSRMSLLCKRPMIVKELTLVLSRPNPTERVQCRVISSLASLLTVWTVRSLDLTDCPIEGYLLTTLLCHRGPLTIRLSEEILQQLAVVVYEAQNEELTQCFLEKVDGDLSNCRLDWNVLHYLLKTTTQPITINLRRSRIRLHDIPHLLPFLNNIHFQRMNSHFERTALKEIHQQRAGHMVTTLVRSSDEWINLNNLVLKQDDCEALRFALHYSDGVKLNLLWTVIPKEEMGKILTLLHRVSELRVDRKLLLELLHAWTGLITQTEAPAALLRVLNHKLDLSCSSAMDLSGQEEDTVLSLSSWDCRAISAAINKADGDTELILHDCQVEDAGLEEFYKESILQRVHLSLGKPILLQLLHLVFVGDGGRSERLASLLSRALGKELDLSHTPLDLMACSSLALILEHSEGLSELDLSDCHLTDTHLEFMLTHLHKAQVLNLCNNEITDEGAVQLNLYMIGNSFTETVWLCNNKITEFDSFLADKRYKLWPAHVPGMQDRHVTNLGSTSVREETSKVFSKTKPIVKEFNPEIVEEVEENKISYRFQCGFSGKFQCRATGLVFGMREPGTVEYSVDHWDMHMLADTDSEPACPVFKISCPEGHMYQLHLLHCETEVYAAEALSVAHIWSNSLEILVPIRVTHSHVIININGLSRWTLLRRKPKTKTKINGQVLLFLELNVTEGQHRLWVYLLSRNVPYTEEKDLHIHNGPDQHATFTVLLDSTVTKLKLMIQELKRMGRKKVWKCQWFEPIFLKPGSNLTESDWLQNLCRILEQLSAKEIKRLKFLVRTSKELPQPSISSHDLGCLEELHDLAELMVKSWGMNGSISATQLLMKELPRKDETVTSLLMPFLEQCVALKGA
ncbi:uncharacterized protein LOC118357513 isoform X3 [Oncorhynchus keta]|uniref:uncharacterized protein LOC118357513 isoform X3 n=1 Tax=Oncorhynchus keta TaxID=8018 RepID=UPI00227D0613|nr:uncharacterized protein LOC118357513 isoform X3 [Oncorhynchus keta]